MPGASSFESADSRLDGTMYLVVQRSLRDVWSPFWIMCTCIARLARSSGLHRDSDCFSSEANTSSDAGADDLPVES